MNVFLVTMGHNLHVWRDELLNDKFIQIYLFCYGRRVLKMKKKILSN